MLKLNSLKRLSLSAKFLPPILGVTLLSLLTGAVLLYSGVEQSSHEQSDLAMSALKMEQQSAEQGLLKALKSKSEIIGRFMAKTAPDLILGYDFTSLQEFQQQATQDKDVSYAAYLKPDGSAFTEFNQPDDKSNIIEQRYPIVSDGENLGFVLIGMSKATVARGIEASDVRIGKAIEQVRQSGQQALDEFSAIIAAVIIVVTVFIAATTILLFRVFVVRPMQETAALIEDLSRGDGDLTIVLPVSYNDEIGHLRLSVNAFVAKLKDMIEMIAQEIQHLGNASTSLKESSGTQTQQARNQQEQTTQVATAMNEMTATVQEVARNATNASQAANDADSEAGQGKIVVNQAVEAIDALAKEVGNAATVINQLKEDSQNIGSVMDVIRGIAEQTNLLALNAAIEAARAGEQGRGFAVVADEVRTLASRTQQSTQEIQEMIELLQARSNEAVNVMEQGKKRAEEGVERATAAGTSLATITSAVASISDMNTQIASAAEEQGAVAEEINRNVVNINDIADLAVEDAVQTSTASGELAALADRLGSLVEQFKIA